MKYTPAFPKFKKPPHKDPLQTLDEYFSKFIRLRDSDGLGFCLCITCGRRFFWKAMDCGHFITRDRKAVRFDERNCHSQCTECNDYKKGEQFKHGQAIDRLYGKGTAKLLENLGAMRGTKLTTEWYEHHIKLYREKVKTLLKEKCLCQQ